MDIRYHKVMRHGLRYLGLALFISTTLANGPVLLCQTLTPDRKATEATAAKAFAAAFRNETRRGIRRIQVSYLRSLHCQRL